MRNFSAKVKKIVAFEYTLIMGIFLEKSLRIYFMKFWRYSGMEFKGLFQIPLKWVLDQDLSD